MSDKIDPTAKEAFLNELTALSKTFGVEIVGCGCCGSPALVRLETMTGGYTVDCDDEELKWTME